MGIAEDELLTEEQARAVHDRLVAMGLPGIWPANPGAVFRWVDLLTILDFAVERDDLRDEELYRLHRIEQKLKSFCRLVEEVR